MTYQEPTLSPLVMHIGQTYFIRTAVMNFIGTVRFTAETHEGRQHTVVLDPCVWVADTGRFAEWLATGKSSNEAETERYPGHCTISLDVLSDFSPWSHPIPETV